jgi:hypothetical protein
MPVEVIGRLGGHPPHGREVKATQHLAQRSISPMSSEDPLEKMIAHFECVDAKL